MVKNGLTFFQNKNKPIRIHRLQNWPLDLFFSSWTLLFVTDSSSAWFSQRGLCVKQTRADMLVNHGCLSSEAPFIHSDALNTQSSVNFSTYAPSSSALCSQHFHRKPFSLLQTSTSPHGRLQHHKPALADPEDRRNSPPAALPARQQSLGSDRD